MRTRVLAATTVAALLPFAVVACGDGEPAVPTVGTGSVSDAPDEAPADGPDLSGEEFTDLTGEDTRQVTVLTDDERPFVIYGESVGEDGSNPDGGEPGK